MPRHRRVSRLVDETTAAVGCSFAISSARFGPEITAICDSAIGSTSAMTSLMRMPVDFSTPFMSDTIGPVGVQVRLGGDEVLAQRLARHGHVDLLGAREREVEPARGAQPDRQVDAGR